jgi:tRNA (guanosine-2'-O-)-methyltransferase
MVKINMPNHQLNDFLLPERLNRLSDVASQRTDSLVVVADRIRNAHNISAVMRSCDAFGVQNLYLIGAEFEFSREISLGSESWLNLRKFSSASEVVSELRQAGFKIAVLQAQEMCDSSRACPVTALPFGEKLAIVLGGELEGVEDEFTAAADIHGYIPMLGFVESLNVSVAAAITLFCSLTSGASMQRRPALVGAERKEELVNEWVQQSVRRSDSILKELTKREEKKKSA